MLGLIPRAVRKLAHLLDVDVSGITAGDTLIYDSSVGKFIGIKNNQSGGAAPTITDDGSKGYTVSSLWFDLTSSPNEIYRCMDNTVGAAVWLNTSLELGDLGSMAVEVAATWSSNLSEVDSVADSHGLSNSTIISANLS